jgi:hypothetical protein
VFGEPVFGARLIEDRMGLRFGVDVQQIGMGEEDRVVGIGLEVLVSVVSRQLAHRILAIALAEKPVQELE